VLPKSTRVVCGERVVEKKGVRGRRIIKEDLKWSEEVRRKRVKRAGRGKGGEGKQKRRKRKGMMKGEDEI